MYQFHALNFSINCARARRSCAPGRCNISTIFPSTVITPLPAFSGNSNASTIACASATSSSLGANSVFSLQLRRMD